MKMCIARLPLILGLLLFSFSGMTQQPPPPGQQPVADSGRLVRIIRADRLTMIKVDSVTEKYVLAGHVELQQGQTLFYCDSAVKDDRQNTVEAFGNIHINDGDSVHTYAQYLKYLGNSKLATFRNKVRLTDGVGVLTTDELQYDMNAGIGTYDKGGKLVNGSTVLTSKEGYYYADSREVYFRQQVKLVDPEYTMATDTLLYDLNRELATFVSATTINDGRTTIRTRSGFYDLKTGNASFGSRPVIEDSAQLVIADSIRYDKRTGAGVAVGNVLYRDTAQGLTILAGQTEFNNGSKQVLAYRKPVMILKQDSDSLYVAADTLVSKVIPDTAKRSGPNTGAIKTAKDPAMDSIRIFRAYRHVRIFSDSLQGVCDSLDYSGADSVFRLFRDPVLWARGSQVTGDTIYLFTRNQNPDKLLVLENGFSINRTAEGFFNQIRGNTLNGIFREGTIDYLRSKGSAESLYYLQNEDSSYFGLNYAKADAITMYFANKELKRVSWVNTVEGTTYPFRQIPEEKKLLKGFKWQEPRRPKSKYELFID